MPAYHSTLTFLPLMFTPVSAASLICWKVVVEAFSKACRFSSPEKEKNQ